MTNGHSIPLGTEVEVTAAMHGHVTVPCTGWVEDWLDGGYGVSVPVTTAFKLRGYPNGSRRTCYFEHNQIRPIVRLLLKDRV